MTAKLHQTATKILFGFYQESRGLLSLLLLVYVGPRVVQCTQDGPIDCLAPWQARSQWDMLAWLVFSACCLFLPGGMPAWLHRLLTGKYEKMSEPAKIYRQTFWYTASFASKTTPSGELLITPINIFILCYWYGRVLSVCLNGKRVLTLDQTRFVKLLRCRLRTGILRKLPV